MDKHQFTRNFGFGERANLPNAAKPPFQWIAMVQVTNPSGFRMCCSCGTWYILRLFALSLTAQALDNPQGKEEGQIKGQTDRHTNTHTHTEIATYKI